MPEYRHTYTQLRQAAKNALKQGDEALAQQIVGRIKEGNYKEDSNDVKSFLLGGAQGATLGSSDEIMAGIGAGVEHMFGPGDSGITGPSKRSFFDKYLTGLESTRGDLETARREDPYATFGGEMVGGLAIPGGAGLAAVKGKSLQAGAQALAKTSAKIGAMAGYGYSESDPLAALAAGDLDKAKQEVSGAAIDTGMGAAIGGLSGFAMPYITAGARSMTKYLTKGFTKNARVTNEGREALVEAYKKDIAGGHITPDGAMQELRDIPELAVGDLGPNLRNEFMRVAQMDIEGGAGIRHFVTKRNREQFNRLYPKLSKALTGQEDNNFARLSADMMADKKTAANTLYGQIAGNPARITDNMRAILRNPGSKMAIRKMNQIRQMEGKAPFDPGDASYTVTVDELDGLLRGFDAQLSSMYKANGKLATAFKKNLAKPLKDEILDTNADLRTARQQWSSDTLVEEAMEQGNKIFSDDYRFTELMLDGLSDAEKTSHKIGVMQAFAKKLEGKSYDADLVKEVIGSPQKERVLSAVFGDRKSFQDFMAYVASENKMFQTMKEAMSNSNTVRKILQQHPDVGRKYAMQFGYNASLGPSTQGMAIGPRLGGAIAESAYGMFNPREAAAQHGTNVANRQAQMLMSKDLQSMMQRQSLGGLLDTGVPQVTAAAVPGLLATGASQADPRYGQ